ncbi:uncharacterized protein LOC127712528 [Mytilus californianus]|uniref:uncharacterized protein LOC127712528 n=1 Tax=Mytilus californianus TaxID=6549 RepID=UPI002247F7E6|nr:uncharacterized protein LOC127712528 [Mytilus californianus]
MFNYLSKMFLLQLVLTALLVVQGNAVCSFPCEQQERGQYMFIVGGSSSLTANEYFRNQSHLVRLLPSGEFAECYVRSGPFLIARRRGNEFTCVKRMAVDPTGGIVVWYGLPFRRFRSNPSVCEICYGTNEWSATLLLANDLRHKRNQIRRSVKIPPMGCNVPKNCPIRNPRLDIPCTGCERVEDDGLCCARDRRRRRYY